MTAKSSCFISAMDLRVKGHIEVDDTEDAIVIFFTLLCIEIPPGISRQIFCHQRANGGAVVISGMARFRLQGFHIDEDFVRVDIAYGAIKQTPELL